MEFLPTLWFVLIAVLYIGYFVLEGFDLGVGILLPFLGKDDPQRRMIINAIGPHWDGNEVWLITAGGATFAAFPRWYATLFSGFYLPLFLLLVGLVIRGAALEFRSKDDNPLWRKTWDWAIFFGSLLPSFLWGVAFTNFVRGVPIDASMQYVGGFWNLLNPFALLGGVAVVLGFLLHGAIFLSLKTTDPIMTPAQHLARVLWLPTGVAMACYSAALVVFTDHLGSLGLIPVGVSVLMVVALGVGGLMLRQERWGWSFAGTAFSLLFLIGSIFSWLYPRVLVSSLDPSFSLTVQNTSSGAMTLHVMTVVAAVFVPIVLAYQAWGYWMLRKRVTGEPESLHY
ncbi:MAG TPA: cytochrome d ubiquinol oxidase subunit II [Longilinea sp.]|nr:cytochrome d ubiquinol oxidase subunit II [Longilinea sp.]